MCLLMLSACQQSPRAGGQQQGNKEAKLDDDSLLTLVQQQTFQYFWNGAEPTSGLARERIHIDGEYPQKDREVVTIGGSGFGLMAIITRMERGFITRQHGVERFEQVIGYLENADRFPGAWPHWLAEIGRASCRERVCQYG